jgi:hypothetical protein
LRLTHWLSLSLLAAMPAAMTVGGADAARAQRPPPESRAIVRKLRTATDHYRSIAWTYQRAARRHVTPTSYSYRRTADPQYLQWTVTVWQRHEFAARSAALGALERRLGVRLPHGPALHASLARRIAFARSLTIRLRRVDPRAGARRLSSARALPPRLRLYTWQGRAARATLAVSRHASRLALVGPRWLQDAFVCIHGYEGAWNANTGNGYYGGLQMDDGFMRDYGSDFMRRWGTADHWPPWAQIAASVRAYRSGRGFWPWPNTARACGLL